MKAGVFLIVPIFGACNAVYGLDETTLDVCPAGGVEDSFEQLDPCAPWGRASEGNATIATAAGTLVVTLGTAQAAQGLCTAFLSNELGSDGARLDVRSVSAAASAYVMLAVTPESRAQINSQLLLRLDRIDLINDTGSVASLPIDALAVRSLRLVPEPDHTAMRGEVATANGWQLVGTIAGAAPGPVFLMFGAGTTAAETAPSTTTFESVRMCAPEP